MCINKKLVPSPHIKVAEAFGRAISPILESALSASSQNREEYERQLAERQKKHLEQIKARKERNWRPCMHDQCTQCHGTRYKWDGSSCIHFISCPCPKCSPSNF